MAHFIYILFSKASNKFYIGETPNVENRLAIHNNHHLNTNSTKSGIPWEIYHIIQVEDRIIARKIEIHLKKLKSREYLKNLKQYSEITYKLIERYS